MTTIPVDDIFRVLRRYPDGLTTVQVAAALNTKPATVAGRLSKLAMYGRIDREFEPSPYAPGSQTWTRWKAKPAAWLPNIASPPL